MRNTHSLDMKFEYDNRIIASISCAKFLGITIENMLYWKSHRDQLLPKVIAACNAIRFLKPFMTQEILVMVYCAYFHSSMNYDFIFWGNSPYSMNIFRLQKKAVRPITNTRNRDSCRYPFKALNILPLQPQYIFLLLCFVVMNMDQ
jgi:hypothetical protein